MKYGFNKTIATATIRFIVTVDIVICKGYVPVVLQMIARNASHLNLRGNSY